MESSTKKVSLFSSLLERLSRLNKSQLFSDTDEADRPFELHNSQPSVRYLSFQTTH